jgi:hypothetical protein
MRNLFPVGAVYGTSKGTFRDRVRLLRAQASGYMTFSLGLINWGTRLRLDSYAYSGKCYYMNAEWGPKELQQDMCGACLGNS